MAAALDFSSSELALPSSPPLFRSDVRLGVLDGGGRLWWWLWLWWWSSAPAGDWDRWCDFALAAERPLSSGGCGGGGGPAQSSPLLLLQLAASKSLLQPVILCCTNRHMSDNRNTLWHWPHVSRSTWSVPPVLCVGSVSAKKKKKKDPWKSLYNTSMVYLIFITNNQVLF